MTTATLSPASLPSWSWLRRQYHSAGAPGLSATSSAVLWRNRQGRIVGVLVRDGMGFIVRVDRRYRRQGIATRLLREALNRWPLDLRSERYTADGAAWVTAFLGNNHG